MYFCDTHIHSSFSFDSNESMERICDAAIQVGLHEIAITDHCDIDGIEDGFYPAYDGDGIRKKICELKETYHNKLIIRYGIELGQPHARLESSETLLKKYPYDFVIGSLHNLDQVPDFSFIKYEFMNDVQINHYFSRALDEMYRMCAFKGISSIAHITYMHRYVKRAGKDIDFSQHTESLKRLFVRMIECGKALEINTSTLRTADFTMPNKEIIKLYRDLGGELITCGSDAHTAEHVGAGIKEAYQMLEDLGIRYIASFEDKKPIMHKIS